MSRLFLADLQTIAQAVYDLAGAEETHYPSAARKVLEDVTISAAIRHELAVKGLAAEAAGLAANLRRGLSPSGDSPRPNGGTPRPVDAPITGAPALDVSVEVASAGGTPPAPTTMYVTVETARTYLSKTQRESRFGTQRRYIDFEPADFANSRDVERAQRLGHASAEKQFESIRKLMIDAGAAVVGDLPDETLVEVFRVLRAD